VWLPLPVAKVVAKVMATESALVRFGEQLGDGDPSNSDHSSSSMVLPSACVPLARLSLAGNTMAGATVAVLAAVPDMTLAVSEGRGCDGLGGPTLRCIRIGRSLITSTAVCTLTAALGLAAAPAVLGPVVHLLRLLFRLLASFLLGPEEILRRLHANRRIQTAAHGIGICERKNAVCAGGEWVGWLDRGVKTEARKIVTCEPTKFKRSNPKSKATKGRLVGKSLPGPKRFVCEIVVR
jgi:hypothetical protein